MCSETPQVRGLEMFHEIKLLAGRKFVEGQLDHPERCLVLPPSRSTTSRKSCCSVSMPSHGSERRRASRAITVRMSNWRLLPRPPSSLQRSGVATGAPLRARKEYDATLVAPRLLRR